MRNTCRLGNPPLARSCGWRRLPAERCAAARAWMSQSDRRGERGHADPVIAIAVSLPCERRSMEEFDGPPVSAGIAGLDDILRGGFTPSRLYLIEGNPGSGKTTLSLQFLLEGVRLGERTLYVTLSETKRELESVARSHGWSLDGIDIHEMEASEENLAPDA